jgi:hypothetical protein
LRNHRNRIVEVWDDAFRGRDPYSPPTSALAGDGLDITGKRELGVGL